MGAKNADNQTIGFTSESYSLKLDVNICPFKSLDPDLITLMSYFHSSMRVTFVGVYFFIVIDFNLT